MYTSNIKQELEDRAFRRYFIRSHKISAIAILCGIVLGFALHIIF